MLAPGDFNYGLESPGANNNKKPQVGGENNGITQIVIDPESKTIAQKGGNKLNEYPSRSSGPGGQDYVRWQ